MANSKTPSFAAKPEVMRITPEQAFKWLEGAPNRPIRPRKVELYAAAMMAGQWKVNNDAIAFSADGDLLNGQHRLWACVESKKSFDSLVIFNVEKDAFLTMDQGAHRSPADHIHTAGYKDIKNGAIVAATAAQIAKYRTNNLYSNIAVAPSVVLEVLAKEPDIIKWVAEARRAPNNLRGFASSIATVLTLGAKRYPEKAEEFLKLWVSGAGLESGSPVLTLRQRVLNKVPAQMSERLYLAASAWNAFVENRPMSRMGYHRSDTFPKIAGTEERLKRGGGPLGIA